MARGISFSEVMAGFFALDESNPSSGQEKGKGTDTRLTMNAEASIFPFFLERILSIPYLSPYWPDDPKLTIGKALSKMISLFHRECDVPACHTLSLMWGSGWPALYEHENLAEVTHKRGADLYGGTSLSYHRHVVKMLGHENTAIRMFPEKPEHKALPENYFQHAAEIDTPVLFMTGRSNRVFSDSNIVCHQRPKKIAPDNPHELLILEGYGHQDPFMGERVVREVFPQFLPFLEKHASGTAKVEAA